MKTKLKPNKLLDAHETLMSLAALLDKENSENKSLTDLHDRHNKRLAIIDVSDLIIARVKADTESQQDWIRFTSPDWKNVLEWIIHPITCVLNLPFFLIGFMVFGAWSWVWNVINSSSIHGSWRPLMRLDEDSSTLKEKSDTEKPPLKLNQHMVGQLYELLEDQHESTELCVEWRTDQSNGAGYYAHYDGFEELQHYPIATYKD